jgi:AraC-like DNA-binding protein
MLDILGARQAAMETLFDTSIFAIAVGLALFAIEQFLYERKRPVNYYTALGFLSLSYVLIFYWCVVTGRIYSHQLMAYSDISATFIVAPAIYLMFAARIGDGDMARRPLVHFAVPAAVTLGLLGYDCAAKPFAQSAALPAAGIDYFAKPWTRALSLASDLWLFGYVLAAFLVALRWRRVERGDRQREARFFVHYLTLLLAAAVGMLMGDILKNQEIFLVASLAYGFAAIAYSLSWARLPPWAEAAKLKRSFAKGRPLDGLDLAALEGQLRGLMDREALYKDADLSVADLATRLSITPTQASALINHELGMNFRTFINRRRLEEVKRELVELPEKSVLDIAFENGFNSKTSFNTLFIKETGISPRDYRKLYAGDRITAAGE